MSSDAETTPTISRADAVARGELFYFTGKPCKNGHVAKRYLSGTCIECAPAYKAKQAAKARAADPEGVRAKISAAVREHYKRNRGAILDKKREYYLLNQEALKDKAKARREAKRAAAASTPPQA
jgi:hypothetical protein